MLLIILVLCGLIYTASNSVKTPAPSGVAVSTPISPDSIKPTKVAAVVESTEPEPTVSTYATLTAESFLQTQVAAGRQTREANGIPTAILVEFTPRYDLMTQNIVLATEMQLTRDAFANPSATPTAYLTSTPVLAPVSWREGVVYAQGDRGVNVRECPRTDCKLVGVLSDGQWVQVTGMLQGEMVVAGNATWYRVKFGGQDAYVYSEYVTDKPPTSVPTNRPTIVIETRVPIQLAQSPYTCNGKDDLNCDDFSNPAEAQAHLEMCGNEDRLDGNDNGLACENAWDN